MKCALHLFDKPEAWQNAVCSLLQQTIDEAVSARGNVHVALSGGSTPKPLYQHLSSQALPWNQIHWWLGDERCVPADHADSNERMIRASLGAGNHAFHLHSWHSKPESDPAASASLYEQALVRKAGNPPMLDFVFLGLGNDGHTASLFPASPALEETKHWAMHQRVPSLNAERWTVTYPTLNAARRVVFLVSGKDKKTMVDRLEQNDLSIPAARVQAREQSIFWLT